MTTPVQDAGAAVRKLGVSPDTYGPTLNTHTDPAATELVGTALADLLTSHAVEQVVVWQGPDDAVLAHVVARRLGAAVTRASELEGVVGFYPPVAAGTRVALLGAAWEPARLRTLLNLAATARAEVAVVAAVVATPALADVPGAPTAALLPGDPR
ncbi:hypothetical protein VSH64_06685 [Amycolatopsis rhabdoformis]|uniref:Uncharacterized protein n=1 Tax=Amycolatopsis rhabdoformis TaxID=1448059 RepID=A0ABZ1IC56_9PSEU|nr:hypothetical protein [Amycolatopsis rhabdoformis]WSE31792.1 hypothetical protein VSH64_06685 [Amycolatopsis rhabdoformis]